MVVRDASVTDGRSTAGRARRPRRPAQGGTDATAASPRTRREPKQAQPARAGLRVLMVTSEALPYSKSGGLADVTAALPLALGELGHTVLTVTPRYRDVTVSERPSFSVCVAADGEAVPVEVTLVDVAEGVRVALVECPRFFDRDGLYAERGVDYADNPLRFASLCRAAFAIGEHLGGPWHVVHAHDWQAGLAPYLLETSYRARAPFVDTASVFTIHNLAYQGLCDKDWVPRLGLRWRDYHREGFEHWDRLSFLKAGINFSRRITTVSPTYAREIMAAEQGFGFEGVLQRRRADVVGILNGIDVAAWDPAHDPFLPAAFDAEHLDGKIVCKRSVLEAYGLGAGADDREPLVGMIARMVDQKGLDLIAQIAHELPYLGARFVVLGTGDAWYQDMWRTLARRHPERIGVRIGFDEGLAHRIEAGADLFLMPSRFEPCGLNQMYSLRYGTLPLVRATGGLDDTVRNFDPTTGEGTGFKFWDYTPAALLGTLRWALSVYRTDPAAWHRLRVRGMAQDFSWTASAANYVKVYEAARTT